MLGSLALLWLLLTLSGIWLSVPAGSKRWRRWLDAWRLPLAWRSPGWAFRWHRGLGLWFAGLFLVLAWSGVGFTLKGVYQPVMGTLGMQTADRNIPSLPNPEPYPALPWEQALTLARLYMHQVAAAKGFHVEREFRLTYDPKRGVFHYRVTSSLDVRQRGETALWLDARSGAPVAWYLPRGEAAGDTLHNWLKALHMAEVGGLSYRSIASLSGLALFALAMLGGWHWLRRQTRRLS